MTEIHHVPNKIAYGYLMQNNFSFNNSKMPRISTKEMVGLENHARSIRFIDLKRDLSLFYSG